MIPPTSSPFISYAQNFEDVMLWRALKDVSAGFYIDVGAYLPREHSVTLAFYERGWYGINIEPNPEAYEQLARERGRDTNLNIAVAAVAGEATISLFPTTGLSTIDPVVARQRILEGWETVTQTVRVETLASLWEKHVPPGQDVHFLKVDVEGFEREVLLGNDWTHNRPWIVVVEATRPLSSEKSHYAWESILIGAGYGSAYADGLNRFYLANEHLDRSSRFEHPPNVFDGFVIASFYDMQERALHAEAELRGVYASRLWRVTRPLRGAVRLIRSTRADPVHLPRQAAGRAKLYFARLLLRAMHFVLGRPALRSRAWNMLRRLPRTEAWLRGAYARDASWVTELQEQVIYSVTDLSDREQDIYSRLKAALTRRAIK